VCPAAFNRRRAHSGDQFIQKYETETRPKQNADVDEDEDEVLDELGLDGMDLDRGEGVRLKYKDQLVSWYFGTRCFLTRSCDSNE
jgi:hypothetical protein